MAASVNPGVAGILLLPCFAGRIEIDDPYSAGDNLIGVTRHPVPEAEIWQGVGNPFPYTPDDATIGVGGGQVIAIRIFDELR